jgi:septal ring factor EnvC (AmiA/AmiB activator)
MSQIEIFNIEKEQIKKNYTIDIDSLKNIYVKFGKSDSKRLIEETKNRISILVKEYKKRNNELTTTMNKKTKLRNELNSLIDKNNQKKQYLIEIINKKV